MYSLWSKKQKDEAERVSKLLRLKRLGHPHEQDDDESMHARERRVRRLYGATSEELAASARSRRNATLDKMKSHSGMSELSKVVHRDPPHPSLHNFRERHPHKEIHAQNFISIAPDSLCPRLSLRGGGLCELEKSRILMQNRRICTAPARLFQLPLLYEKQKYPFRSREPHRELGRAARGRSTGNMVFKLFKDAERISEVRSTQQPTTREAWSPETSLSRLPVFRKIEKRKFKSMTRFRTKLCSP